MTTTMMTRAIQKYDVHFIRIMISDYFLLLSTFNCASLIIVPQNEELTTKQWGNKRGLFYDTDHVDPDWGHDSEEEEVRFD